MYEIREDRNIHAKALFRKIEEPAFKVSWEHIEWWSTHDWWWNPCSEWEATNYKICDNFRKHHETLRAVKIIQNAVREWLWQITYSNGHPGFHFRKAKESFESRAASWS